MIDPKNRLDNKFYNTFFFIAFIHFICQMDSTLTEEDMKILQQSCSQAPSTDPNVFIEQVSKQINDVNDDIERHILNIISLLQHHDHSQD